jgi:hypothetical protein
LRRALLAAAVHLRVRDGTRITRSLEERAARLAASESEADREIGAHLQSLLDG